MSVSLKLILATIIGATTALAFYMQTSHNSADPIDLTGRGEVHIDLTDDGFSPSKMYVSRGTKVTFTTSLNTHFWPASDLHPLHKIYPIFDPKRPIDPDESWSFVFDKDGHWNFHDHIGLQTGAIIVVPPGEKGDPIYNTIVSCDYDDRSVQDACYKNRIALALENRGLESAFDEVAFLHDMYPDFRGNCHFSAHDLGLLAFQHYGEKFPHTDKTSYCGQGFYHGFMEGFLSQNDGDVERALEICEEEGKKFADSRPLNGSQCLHGIGHGVMEHFLRTRPDLADRISEIIELGLNECAKMETEDGKFRCASGVYAVTKDWINIQGLHNTEQKLFSLEQPFELCKLVDKDWQQRACAWEMAKQTLILAKSDTAKTFDAQIRGANAWNSGKHLPLIILSTAYLVGEKNVKLSDVELADKCAPIEDSALRASCIEGITRGVIFNGSPENEIERATTFCLESGHTDAEISVCAGAIVRAMHDTYGEEGLARACSTVLADIVNVKEMCG